MNSIPEHLQDSPLYSLYLVLEAMPEEPDDWEDKRMVKLYDLVDRALILEVTPEEILKIDRGETDETTA